MLHDKIWKLVRDQLVNNCYQIYLALRFAYFQKIEYASLMGTPCLDLQLTKKRSVQLIGGTLGFSSWGPWVKSKQGRKISFIFLKSYSHNCCLPLN